jgi:hypothetical protein
MLPSVIVHRPRDRASGLSRSNHDLPGARPDARPRARVAAHASLATLLAAIAIGIVVQLDLTECTRCRSILSFAPLPVLTAIVVGLANNQGAT